jgi:hypothetical protein
VQKPPATTPGLGAATAACANVAAIASGMRRRASRGDDLPIDFIKGGVVILFLICLGGLLNCILQSSSARNQESFFNEAFLKKRPRFG